ncbi:MAG: SMP-30/gluconolactonase/LRE family protein [Gammaproteobacteria bacterium]
MLATCIWSGQNVLGEGPLWDHRDQLLYWLDIAKAELHCFDLPANKHRAWQMSEPICCIGLRAEGGFIAAWKSGFGTIELPSGKFNKLTLSLSAAQGTMFNDGKVDHQGRFWAGTKDLLEQKMLGSLYCLSPDGLIKELDHGFTVSNGIAWSLDNKTLYFTDSPARTIYQYDFNPATGDISNRRVFVTVANDAGYPDGLTIDSEGYLWGAHWGGWRVTRYKPTGQVDRVVEMPVEQPTSCCFGGEDLDILFVTSASRDLTPAQLARGRQAGGLFTLHPGVKGLPEPLFVG